MTTKQEREKALEALDCAAKYPDSRNYFGDCMISHAATIRAILTEPSAETQEPEWFYRWASRAMGGNCTAQEAIGVIFHCPNNPYKDKNPWETNMDAPVIVKDKA